MDADLDVQDSKEETVSLEGVLWKKLIFFVEVRQVEILLLIPIIIIQTKIKKSWTICGGTRNFLQLISV